MKITTEGCVVKAIETCCDDLFRQLGTLIRIEPCFDEIYIHLPDFGRVLQVHYCPACGAKIEFIGED